MELNLLRKVKGNRKDFYRCMDSNTQAGKKSHGSADGWGRGHGDEGHGEGQSTQCLPCLGLYWWPFKSEAPEICEEPWRNWDTLHSKGLVKGTLSQTRKKTAPWDLMGHLSPSVILWNTQSIPSRVLFEWARVRCNSARYKREPSHLKSRWQKIVSGEFQLSFYNCFFKHI